MPKKPKTYTPAQLKAWENHSADIAGEFVPIDPQNINVAAMVDDYIKHFGIDKAADHADFRVECAHHQEDKDDWADVARIIRERQIAATQNKS
jgi:hypothetical protein